MLTLSMSAFRGKPDIPSSLANAANDPKRTSGLLVGFADPGACGDCQNSLLVNSDTIYGG